jgi:hypothetical protein
MENNTTHNAYDMVDFFYKSDPDWNLVLDRQYTEEFLRLQAFKGQGDEDLYYIWSQVLSLCYYLASGTTQVGDLSADDFIDSVAWCGRNLPDFQLTAGNVAFYLRICDQLLKFLKSKRAISDASAAALARQKLIVGSRLQIINSDGTFKKGFEDRELHHTPDLRIKMSLNEMGETQHLQAELLKFFQKEKYEADIFRASTLYFGESRKLKDLQCEPGMEPGEISDFWDYFLFDYDLSANLLTPIQAYYYFYRQNHPKPGLAEQKKLAFINKYLNVKLTFFQVLGIHQTGNDGSNVYAQDVFDCQNIFTDECFQLCLPFDLPDNLEEALFMGHIFPDGNVMSDYVRSVHVGKLSLQKLRELADLLLQAYRLQKPEAKMEDFIRENAALVISLFAVKTRFYVSDTLLKAANRPAVTQAPLLESGNVHDALCELADFLTIPARDQNLMLQMWSDYFAAKVKKKQQIGTLKREVDILTWVLALIYAFLTISHGEPCSMELYTTFLKVPLEVVLSKGNDVLKTLQVEPYDPRYLSEEGFLTLAHRRD